MPTLRFSLQLDEYKPAPDTIAEPRPTDVAAECKPRWALHEYVKAAFFSTPTPEKWQEDEHTDEKACAICNEMTVPRNFNRCSTCKTTYCNEVCYNESTKHDRLCTKFADFPMEKRPSEHHYRALFLPCIDDLQFVWLKVTFDESIGKLHIETDRQEAFEYVKEMKLPATAWTVNNEWSDPITPFGIDLITFNANENAVRQEKWINHSLLGFAPPGHVGIVSGPAFLISYDVGDPPEVIDIGVSSTTAGNEKSATDDVRGEAYEGDEGAAGDEEGDEKDDNEVERNESKSGKQKAKGGSARRKRGKGKGKGKQKKRVPRPRRAADGNNADTENAQNENEAPVDIPDARGPFRICRDIGIRETDFAIKCYIANGRNPVDGVHWLPVRAGCFGHQMHAIKINNLKDERLAVLGVEDTVEQTSLSRAKFIDRYSLFPCAAMYSLGLRWHVESTMPSGAPLDLSGADEDPDYVASERIFGAVVEPVTEGSLKQLAVNRLEHMGSFTLAQVNGGEILPGHIKAVRAYHEHAFLHDCEDKMSEQGFREYWEGMKGDGFINPGVPSPYDLEREDYGLWNCSKEIRARIQRTRRSEWGKVPLVETYGYEVTK
ncbi:hypothetical protein CGCSCA4_v001693 [Colletotrichum siamense]|uniref:Suppressor of anucleate metulae protein B n=1 Tax=Colletotrichum siamense TaxID=690259 RepID=A0A9P5F1D7_COLSI|nr:hypothetical protein CGCSCA4_v001693 [Colletotrichum siamense]KAF4864387.1 hypothetical protein CGCSCA2_v001829 [Colletotrichum siamense]